MPVGKLPGDLLSSFLHKVPCKDAQVVVGPGIGEDVAVVRIGGKLLIAKTDPVTLAAELIGWYVVNINANDIATAGVQPRWFMATVLLPEKSTRKEAEHILDQMLSACDSLGVTLVGGHTEISYGLKRPIITGCMLAETADKPVITTAGAQAGDDIVLTKGIAIEGTALLARESATALREAGMSSHAIKHAAGLLFKPGISVLKEALVARKNAEIHAMHDPTEGGLASALWELAEASGCSLVVDVPSVPVPDLAMRICRALGLDPLASIASGALLFTVVPADASQVRRTLESEGILCAEIGRVEPGPPAVWRLSSTGRALLTRPERDEIARLFG